MGKAGLLRGKEKGEKGKRKKEGKIEGS